MSLVELLTAVAIVGILAGTSIHVSRVPLAHQQLLAAARQLELGIEQARDQAMDQQAPCALALGEAGWVEPDGGSASGVRGYLDPGGVGRHAHRSLPTLEARSAISFGIYL